MLGTPQGQYLYLHASEAVTEQLATNDSPPNPTSNYHTTHTRQAKHKRSLILLQCVQADKVLVNSKSSTCSLSTPPRVFFQLSLPSSFRNCRRHNRASSGHPPNTSRLHSSSPKMGKLFKAYLNQNDGKVWSCFCCAAHLAYHDDIISKNFQGKHGRAYLISNVYVDPLLVYVRSSRRKANPCF